MTKTTYRTDNIFAKILRREIPCDKVYESPHVLAFRDIAPQSREHILVIPKRAYVSLEDFTAHATTHEIAEFFRAVGEVARRAGLVAEGYRVLANHGPHAAQEVPHFHVHVCGGEPLGPLLVPAALRN